MCAISRDYQTVIRNAYANDRQEQAALYEALLYQHQQSCPECAGVVVVEVGKMGNQTWYEVKKK